MIAGALVASLGACIDFVEPDLPERGAPAVVQATLRAGDDGSLAVEALLTPGLDEDGFRRTLLREALIVADTAIAPIDVARNGTRSYVAAFATAFAPEGEIRFEAPVVRAVGAAPPSVAWSGIRALDDDTVRVSIGDDLVLRITTEGAEDPRPELRQWQVQLTAAERSFRLGGDGVPPDTIVVPARWLPPPDEGHIAARLSYTRSAEIRRSPGDYVGLVLLDVRLNWTVRMTDPAMATVAVEARIE